MIWLLCSEIHVFTFFSSKHCVDFHLAIFKYQGYEVKELADDDYEPIIDSSGDLKVIYIWKSYHFLSCVQ